MFDKSKTPGKEPRSSRNRYPRRIGSVEQADRATWDDDGSDETQGAEFNPFNYLRVISKHRRVALTGFLLVATWGTVSTLTKVPVFEARTRLILDPGTPNVLSFQEVVDDNRMQFEWYETQFNILKSRTLARRTVAALKLSDDPAFAGNREETPSLKQRVADWIGWTTEPSPSPNDAAPAPAPSVAAQEPPDETAADSGAISAFLGSLTVSPMRNSHVVEVGFRSPDPRLAARAVNRLAQEYMAQNLEYRYSTSKEASDWLSDQLAEQREKVEASEAALQRYREENDAISLEDRQSIVVQKLTELNSAVTRAKTDRIAAEARFRQLRALQNDPAALDTLPEILGNSFIQGLKGEVADLSKQLALLSDRLGERHPDLIKARTALQTAEARLRAEIDKIVRAVESEYRSSAALENDLVGALRAQTDEALAVDRRGIEYGVLRRDAESNREIYESLLQRVKETGISREMKANNIRVLDEAEVPQWPVSPQVQRDVLRSMAGGLVLAIALAFLFERFDNRIKNPDDMKKAMGLPSLGLIPEAGKRFTSEHPPLLNNGVPASVVESFREIQTNLLFSRARDEQRSVLVTSTIPGEGKTLVSVNLAMALAQGGAKVLLVDADMRRPRVHEVLKMSQKPGLSSVITGAAEVSDAVHTLDVPNLSVMPAGPTSPNPVQLVTSRRFREILQRAEAAFDWVIIDSPPVMAVADAAAIGPIVGGILFVVGTEMTGRRMARDAVGRLAALNAAFFGAVLNRVNVDKNAYYYSEYYRRQYKDYYTPKDEKGGEAPMRRRSSTKGPTSMNLRS